MSLNAGQTFGKYTIVSLLGRGGMAEVYVARDHALDREVAIKILHAHFADEPGFLERFRSEARAVARLRHPAIVQVFEFDVAESQPYMVMEYLRGGSIKDRFVRARDAAQALPPEEALALARTLGSALDHAHENGLIHCDIKPSNILLTATHEPVLADFGIARLIGEARHTAAGTVTGTPAYMSPEQGRGKADARSDFYSLAVVLYEMVAGRTPFTAETPTEMLLKHLQVPAPSPLTWRADLPEALEAFFAKALAKQPNDRFQSGAELSNALAEALGVQPVAEVPNSLPAVAALSAEPATGTPKPIQEAATVVDAPLGDTPVPAPAPRNTTTPVPEPGLASPPVPQPAPVHAPIVPTAEAASKPAKENMIRRAIGRLSVVSEVVAPMVGRQALTYDAARQTRRERLTATLAIVGIILAAFQYVVSTLDLLSRSLATVWNSLPFVTVIALLLGAIGAIATLRSPAAPQRTKRITGSALAAIVVAGGGWLGWHTYESVRLPAGPIVLVADFERCGSCPEIEFGRRIYQRIKQETDRLKLPGVEVRRAFETYPDAATARARGREQKAVVVIWGSYDSAGVMPQLEMLELPSSELSFLLPVAMAVGPPQGSAGGAGGKPPYPAKLFRPEDLSAADFHLEGGDREAAFMGLLGLGLARFSAGDDENAIRLFDAAIQQLPASSKAAPNAEYAYFLKGVVQTRTGSLADAVASLGKAAELKPALPNAHAWLGLTYLSFCTPEGRSTYEQALSEAETAVRLRSDAITQWVLGVVQYQWGRYADAARSFERSLQDRDDPDVRAWLASAYRRAGRIDAAQREVQKIAEAEKISPTADEVQRLRAGAERLYEAGDFGGAALDYQRALTRALELKRPQTTLARLNLELGLTFMARAQYTDALKYLDASQALAPVNWSGSATRGLALMRLGQTARAETAFRQALDADPCNYGAQYFLGDLYGAQQQHQKALEAYHKAAALEPFNGLPWLSIAREQSLLGNSAEREAAWRKALPLLEEAMREQPADAGLPFLVGITNFLLKQYEAAVTAFRKQVELTPTDGDGHYYLGASLAALGRHAEAVPELELALKAYPDDSVTMLDLAEAYQKTQRILEALALYQKIVAVDKQNIAAWLGIANLAAANANWTQSAGAWEALVALDPKDADARASLAYAYMQLKRYGAAAREYRTAAEASPGNLRHRAGEAWALAMDGQADAALSIAREVLVKATKGDSAEALAHFASGLALKAQGQKAEAILAFQAAVQSSPTKEVRELAEAELALLRQ